jgi:hypothetical protein
MLPHELEIRLIQFLNSAQARSLCRSYGVDPLEALGDLYLRLLPRATNNVINVPDVWVPCNAMGLLRNHLRREHCVRV